MNHHPFYHLHHLKQVHRHHFHHHQDLQNILFLTLNLRLLRHLFCYYFYQMLLVTELQNLTCYYYYQLVTFHLQKYLNLFYLQFHRVQEILYRCFQENVLDTNIISYLYCRIQFYLELNFFDENHCHLLIHLHHHIRLQCLAIPHLLVKIYRQHLLQFHHVYHWFQYDNHRPHLFHQLYVKFYHQQLNLESYKHKHQRLHHSHPYLYS